MLSVELALFGLLGCATVKAFEITVYGNIGNCDANNDTVYRTIRGASNGTCYSFNEAMPDTDCVQYNESSTEEPIDCTSEPICPISIVQNNGDAVCTFYSQESCHGSSLQIDDNYVLVTSARIERFNSFLCIPDQTVDILGNVGCHSAVSTDACVNDCKCVCNGQVLYCPPKASRCNPAAYRLCRSYCNCTTPCGDPDERQHVQNKHSSLITRIFNLVNLMIVRLAEFWW